MLSRVRRGFVPACRGVRPARSATRLWLARWLTAGGLTASILLPATALADPEAAAKAGWKAYAEGRMPDALGHAESGLAEKVLTKLIYLKAVSLWKLARPDEAWAVIQLVQPGTLPVDLQASFPSDFEAMEQAVKDAKVAREQRKAAYVQAEAQRKVEADARTAKMSRGFWLTVGGVAVGAVGAGTMLFGVETAKDAGTLPLADAATHAEYKETFSTARLLWYAGAGIAAVGTGLAVWGLADQFGAGEAAPVPSARLAPWMAPEAVGRAPAAMGFLLSGRF